MRVLQISRAGEKRSFIILRRSKGALFWNAWPNRALIFFESMDELQRRSLRESSRRSSAMLLELARTHHTDSVSRDIQGRLAQEEDRYFRILSTLKVDHPGFASLASPVPCKLDAVQRTLKNRNTAIIEYFLGDRGSFVLKIKSDSLRIYPLATRKSIEESVKPFLKYLSSPPRKEIEGSKAGRRST